MVAASAAVSPATATSRGAPKSQVSAPPILRKLGRVLTGFTSGLLAAYAIQQERPPLMVAIAAVSLVTCQWPSTLLGAVGSVSEPTRRSSTPEPAVPLPPSSCSCTFGKASWPL